MSLKIPCYSIYPNDEGSSDHGFLCLQRGTKNKCACMHTVLYSVCSCIDYFTVVKKRNFFEKRRSVETIIVTVNTVR